MALPALEAVDDEDDSFERVEDLNHLELPDDEDGDSSGSDSELDDELKIMKLKLDVSDAESELDLLRFDFAVVKAALGLVSFAFLLSCLYIFTYSGHAETCPAPPPAIECPKIPVCPPAPPVPECLKCPPECPVVECPPTSPSLDCPKVPACKEKPWDYENPSLKLESYDRGSKQFSRDVDLLVKGHMLSVTGGFVTGFTWGGVFLADPHIGEEIIAVEGVDVREKSAQEIDAMIHKPRSVMENLLGVSTSRWEDSEHIKGLHLTVRNNTVYYKRIRDAVAEASDVSFKRGVIVTVLIMLLGLVLLRDFVAFINKSKYSSSDYAVESSGQLPTTANADAVNNANASEKTFVQQLGDCAGVEAETENDGVEQHAKEETTNMEERVSNQQTVDIEAEEKKVEETDLTAVINAQKVQVEDNRVELEMFADRLAELKRDCERMEKARDDLASLKSESETKRSWLDRMLDECGIPQNGG